MGAVVHGDAERPGVFGDAPILITGGCRAQPVVVAALQAAVLTTAMVPVAGSAATGQLSCRRGGIPSSPWANPLRGVASDSAYLLSVL